MKKKIEIVSVTENSPASEYDIKEGDILTAVDGIDAENVEYDNLIDDTMCTGCGLCASLCKFDAIELVKEGDR